MVGNSKWRGTLKTVICEPSDGVERNEYHTVLG